MKVVQATSADIRKMGEVCGVPESVIRNSIVDEGLNVLVATEGGHQHGYVGFHLKKEKVLAPFLFSEFSTFGISPTTHLIRAVRRFADSRGFFGPIEVMPYGEDATECVLYTHGAIGQANNPPYRVS